MNTLLLAIVPYAAVLTFLVGIVFRVARWARSPVPFRIPATLGQQRSLPWIRSSWTERPVVRVALEVVAFRSLARRQQAERSDVRLVYGPSLLLWIGAIAFHWSLLVILLRHLRLVLNPVPKAVAALGSLDGFFQIGMPVVYCTDVMIVAALLYLTGRRIVNAQVRYLSLPADYVSLAMLLAVAGSGILMRYCFRTDIAAVKQYATSMAAFMPLLRAGVGPVFYVHISLVSLLAAWFPFSKLMHMGGIFLSPTRNLANNSRAKRHVNPWDYPVPVHTYEEWEDEFRDKIAAAGLPLEKQ
jgi:nitrate reductase gamma subunit